MFVLKQLIIDWIFLSFLKASQKGIKLGERTKKHLHAYLFWNLSRFSLIFVYQVIRVFRASRYCQEGSAAATATLILTLVDQQLQYHCCQYYYLSLPVVECLEAASCREGPAAATAALILHTNNSSTDNGCGSLGPTGHLLFGSLKGLPHNCRSRV